MSNLGLNAWLLSTVLKWEVKGKELKSLPWLLPYFAALLNNPQLHLLSPLTLIPSSAFASWFTWFFHVTSTLKSGAVMFFTLVQSCLGWFHLPSLQNSWKTPHRTPRSASFMDHPLKIAFWQVTTALNVSHLCVPYLFTIGKLLQVSPPSFLSFLTKPFPPILHQLKLQSTPAIRVGVLAYIFYEVTGP